MELEILAQSGAFFLHAAQEYRRHFEPDLPAEPRVST